MLESHTQLPPLHINPIQASFLNARKYRKCWKMPWNMLKIVNSVCGGYTCLIPSFYQQANCVHLQCRNSPASHRRYRMPFQHSQSLSNHWRKGICRSCMYMNGNRLSLKNRGTTLTIKLHVVVRNWIINYINSKSQTWKKTFISYLQNRSQAVVEIHVWPKPQKEQFASFSVSKHWPQFFSQYLSIKCD